MIHSEKNLHNLYKDLGNLRNDFRNYNLTILIASKVNGDSVLDIGCGNSFLLGVLSKRGKKTFGIENDKELINLSIRINPELNILHGAAEDIDRIFKKKVDAITIIDVLEHIKNDDEQIKKIKNHLNDEGLLIIVVPAYAFLYGNRDEIFGHYRRYSKSRLIKLLFENGFKIKYVRYWNMLGFFPYLLSEKCLKKQLSSKLRKENEKGIMEKLLIKFLNLWFKYIENNFNLGFGLSLICMAEKE